MIISVTIISIILFFYIRWESSNIVWLKPKHSYRVIGSEMLGKEEVIEQQDGTKIRTKSIGNGQPVVLAHDYGTSLLTWNLLARELIQSGFKVIVFDQRGHCKSTIGKSGVSSQSMITAYRDVLNHYDVKEGILVGHGMGGFLAIVFMQTYPELVQNRLKSTILISSYASILDKQTVSKWLYNLSVKTGIFHYLTRIQTFGFQYGKSFLGNKLDKNIIKAYLKSYNYNNHKKLSPILNAINRENYSNNLDKIDIPCTIISGTHNNRIPSYHSRELANPLTKSKVVYIEGKGHLLN